MNTVTQPPIAPTLVLARHVVGMAVVALGNPLIYFDSRHIEAWLMTWVSPLLLAGLIFGLFSLFFTERAKSGWPGGFLKLAWVLTVAAVIVPWLERDERPAAQVAQPAPVVTPAQAPVAEPAPVKLVPFNGKLDSEIDEILKDAPAYQPPR